MKYTFNFYSSLLYFILLNLKIGITNSKNNKNNNNKNII